MPTDSHVSLLFIEHPKGLQRTKEKKKYLEVKIKLKPPIFQYQFINMNLCHMQRENRIPSASEEQPPPLKIKYSAAFISPRFKS